MAIVVGNVYKFKSKTRLFVFQTALIPFGKVYNYSHSSNGYIVGKTVLFELCIATGLEEGKLWIQTC